MQRQALRPDTASYLEASSDKRERANAEPDPDQPDYNAELENFASESESEEQADPDDDQASSDEPPAQLDLEALWALHFRFLGN